jgi:hypothetical protein
MGFCLSNDWHMLSWEEENKVGDERVKVGVGELRWSTNDYTSTTNDDDNNNNNNNDSDGLRRLALKEGARGPRYTKGFFDPLTSSQRSPPPID